MDFQSEITNLINRDLITVQKPGRYVGGEFNQILKRWDDVDFHVALAFPDIYDIGFPNLGIAALYNAINTRNDALAERSFSPWKDMEDLLRIKGIPLFTLESKRPVNKFDLVGFSIPYETLYTNVLNFLDLSNIPIHTIDRTDTDPVIIAGGHATFNPEPMHAFIDAFVIGEGEEVIHEIIDVLIKNTDRSRSEKLQALNEISAVYIPSLYPERNSVSFVNSSNITAKIAPTQEKVMKRIVRKLDAPIHHMLVPNIEVVHDRIAIEIMRGCSRGCRFCQAGMVMRPVREFSSGNIIASVKEMIVRTGITELSLLSLSTSDHTQINMILDEVNTLSEQYHLDFSLPSLRIESFGQEMMDAMSSKRKGNFTIAPEAGSDTRRAAINKPIPEADILETVTQICEKGWNNIKLYFMIGFPGESMDDIQAIIDLCRQIHSIGKKAQRGRFVLNVSINTLIPKAHTPYQWAPLEAKESVILKYTVLRDGLRPLQIKVNYPDYDLVQLEALLSRGDRDLSKLIYSAWKNGAKFDAWREGYSAQIWQDAANETGIDIPTYLFEEKSLDQVFPWDHINIGVDKDFLKQEFLKNRSGELTPGCFERCAACGVNRNLAIDCSKARAGAL